MARQPEQGKQETVEYELATTNLADLGNMLKDQILRMLEDAGIVIHNIDARVKVRENASEKMAASSGKYVQFSDLDDLLGVRIITYFPRQVDAVAEVIAREFIIDPDKSVDKRSLLDPDRFGYLSLHYIAKLNDKRGQLAENRKFVSSRFEVQIRSILQHAWAEIEHDLGYKSNQAVPEEIRRRFSRLAGLLEIADSEFQAIRDSRDSYEIKVSKEIKRNPQNVSLDQTSVTKLIESDATVLRIDMDIAQRSTIRAVIATTNGMANFVAERVDTFSFLNISDVKTINDLLNQHEEEIIKLATAWISYVSKPGTIRNFLPRGISLLYLSYFLVLQHAHSDLETTAAAFSACTPRVSRRDALVMRRIYLKLSNAQSKRSTLGPLTS